MIYIKLLGTFFTVFISYVLIFRPELVWERAQTWGWLSRYLPDARSLRWDRRITALGLLILGLSLAIVLTLPNNLGLAVALIYLPFILWRFS